VTDPTVLSPARGAFSVEATRFLVSTFGPHGVRASCAARPAE